MILAETIPLKKDYLGIMLKMSFLHNQVITDTS